MIGDTLVGQKLEVGSDGTLVDRRRVTPDLLEWSGTLRNVDPGGPRKKTITKIELDRQDECGLEQGLPEKEAARCERKEEERFLRISRVEEAGGERRAGLGAEHQSKEGSLRFGSV